MSIICCPISGSAHPSTGRVRHRRASAIRLQQAARCHPRRCPAAAPRRLPAKQFRIIVHPDFWRTRRRAAAVRQHLRFTTPAIPAWWSAARRPPSRHCCWRCSPRPASAGSTRLADRPEQVLQAEQRRYAAGIGTAAGRRGGVLPIRRAGHAFTTTVMTFTHLRALVLEEGASRCATASSTRRWRLTRRHGHGQRPPIGFPVGSAVGVNAGGWPISDKGQRTRSAGQRQRQRREHQQKAASIPTRYFISLCVLATRSGRDDAALGMTYRQDAGPGRTRGDDDLAHGGAGLAGGAANLLDDVLVEARLPAWTPASCCCRGDVRARADHLADNHGDPVQHGCAQRQPDPPAPACAAACRDRPVVPVLRRRGAPVPGPSGRPAPSAGPRPTGGEAAAQSRRLVRAPRLDLPWSRAPWPCAHPPAAPSEAAAPVIPAARSSRSPPGDVLIGSASSPVTSTGAEPPQRRDQVKLRPGGSAPPLSGTSGVFVGKDRSSAISSGSLTLFSALAQGSVMAFSASTAGASSAPRVGAGRRPPIHVELVW